VKRFYARTNKRNPTYQIAKHQRREAIIRSIASRDPTSDNNNHGRKSKYSEIKDIPFMSPNDHHHIADSQRAYCDILAWVHENKSNPCVKVDPRFNLKTRLTDDQGFIPRLKDHVLARFHNVPYDGNEHAFLDSERNSLIFAGDRMYRHEAFRVNYTTYDTQRAQDSINIRTHPHIMVLAHEDDEENDSHPYWYAKVLGIYHVNARLSDEIETRRVDFLWVHWFGRDLEHRGGFETRRLHRIGLMEPQLPESYGFIDPSDVLRGVHLIPGFEIGRIPSNLTEDKEEWEYFYISMYFLFIIITANHTDIASRFVDRDMFMRFLGGGIGHKVTEHVQQNIVSSQREGHDDSETAENSEGDIFINENTETEPTDHQENGDENDSEDIEEVDVDEELDFGYGEAPVSESEEEGGHEEDSDEEEDNYDEF